MSIWDNVKLLKEISCVLYVNPSDTEDPHERYMISFIMSHDILPRFGTFPD